MVLPGRQGGHGWFLGDAAIDLECQPEGRPGFPLRTCLCSAWPQLDKTDLQGTAGECNRHALTGDLTACLCPRKGRADMAMVMVRRPSLILFHLQRSLAWQMTRKAATADAAALGDGRFLLPSQSTTEYPKDCPSPQTLGRLTANAFCKEPKAYTAPEMRPPTQFNRQLKHGCVRVALVVCRTFCNGGMVKAAMSTASVTLTSISLRAMQYLGRDHVWRLWRPTSAAFMMSPVMILR